MPRTVPTLRPRSKPGRRAQWALFAGSLLFALALAELALRVWSPDLARLRQLVESTDDDRVFVPKRNVRIRFDGVFSPLSRPIVWQTNAQGLRDDHVIGAPDGRFRVATYGDSETFGWAVALEDGFQRRMQALDPRVEVLNLGVPGYNVNNVREHLERTVPLLRPDLVVYLINKNDFNEPVHLTALSHSYLLLHLRFLWHFTIGRELRLANRDTQVRFEAFATEVERMSRFLAARETPLLLAALNLKHAHRTWIRESTPDTAAGGFRRELVNVEPVVEGAPKEDTHYAASAHRKMAAFLCERISGAAGAGCVPPGWTREGAGAEAAAPTLSAVR